jgi:hypothetical protein
MDAHLLFSKKWMRVGGARVVVVGEDTEEEDENGNAFRPRIRVVLEMSFKNEKELDTCFNRV